MDDGREEPGCPAHLFGNAIAHDWAKEMPRELRSGLLKLLYALRAVARPDGTVAGEWSPYRITQIAQFCGADEKDTRRYLRAAMAAGVVVIPPGEKVTRGKANVYMLRVLPRPDWQAAVDSLKESRPKPSPKRAASAPPWRDSSGDRPPNQSSGDQPPNGPGDRPPNPEQGGSGDRPPTEFGGPTPAEFGGPTPGFSGSTHEQPQEMAGVVPQPQDARARGDEPTERRPPVLADEVTAAHFARCRECSIPLIRPGRELCHGCELALAKAERSGA